MILARISGVFGEINRGELGLCLTKKARRATVEALGLLESNSSSRNGGVGFEDQAP